MIAIVQQKKKIRQKLCLPSNLLFLRTNSSSFYLPSPYEYRDLAVKQRFRAQVRSILQYRRMTVKRTEAI